MRIRDRIFASVLLEANRDANLIEVSLEGFEAECLALALEKLGCVVDRAVDIGKLFVHPPTPYAALQRVMAS